MSTEAIALRGSARLGAMLVLLSAVAWSLAGPLTKGVAADAWAILAWRGVFSGVVIIGYAGWRAGGMFGELRRMGSVGWVASTIGSVATTAFILAFKLTAVAHVVVIYGTAPLLAAGVAWLWFRERTTRAAVIASVTALGGVAIMVAGPGRSAGFSLIGDALALLMTVLMAVMMAMIRHYRSAPMVLAAGVSSAQLLVIGLGVGALAGGTDTLMMPAGEIATLALFGLLHAAAVVLLTEGARLLAAAETALLGALEVPMATAWAWLLLGEVPPPATLLGGGIVLAALVWHLGRRQG